MDCGTPGFHVHHQSQEVAQTHVHGVSDAIQPFHLLLSLSPAFNPSQHQGLFQWVNSLYHVLSFTYSSAGYPHYHWDFELPRCYGRRRQWHPTPVLLPGKSHGWRSLVGCSPWGREESDMTERLHFQFSLSCIGEGNGNPLQCSCLENPRDGGAWWAAVYRVTQSRTRLKQLSSRCYGSLERTFLKDHVVVWPGKERAKINPLPKFPILDKCEK